MAQRRLGFWRRFAVGLVLPVMTVWTKRTWIGLENIPATGGVIIVPNHASHFDPLVVAHYIYGARRWPRFLGKASLWKVPVMGPFLRKVQQIPVERGSVEAVKSLDALVEAINADGVVVIYPEGTTTRHPDLWPMRGKTGAVRIALETGVPLIPAAHWGAQKILPRWGRRISLFPRKTVDIIIGEPLDLSRWQGRQLDAKALAEATLFVMQAITALLEGLRGEKAPAERWDPAEHGQTEFGRIRERKKPKAPTTAPNPQNPQKPA